MLKRKIENKLIDWKNTKKNEVLLIIGARQIGKTFIIKKFGLENYKSFIYINFAEEKDKKQIFDGNLDADTIYKNMNYMIEGINLIEHDTLIFLDEIQECPNARTALKFLALDNKYDIIASGSLLGLKYKGVVSYPVGYEKQIKMHSLDFEEFLWANNIENEIISELKENFINKTKINSILNNKILNLLKNYIIVGGMPEVVNEYIDSKNFNKIYDTKKKILDNYKNDITSFEKNSIKIKTLNAFLSIPAQLAKENKKFIYKTVEKDARARSYDTALEWLRDANITTFCYNIKTPTFPLETYTINDQFKIYINDIGMLTAMYPFEIIASILNDTLSMDAKGGIYENLIADILIKKNKNLFYYKINNTTMEIEFFVYDNDNVIPVEVKAKNGHTISLNNYINQFNPKSAYKLINGNIGYENNKITMPLYMAMFL